MENLWALLVGIIMGGGFAFLKLPIPAPQNLAGILGAFGVFIGAIAVQHFCYS